VAAAPDVVLIPARGLESVGGIDGLLTLPGMALTPAGSTRRVIAMDDLSLLGFGPRLGQAVRELTARFSDALPGSGP
jgi:iron complex transport system substrate-binding protein